MKETKSVAKKKNTWIWVIVIIVALLILFFAFRGDKSLEEETSDDITALDVGDNPDIGVDDFNSLQVSQEDLVS